MAQSIASDLKKFLVDNEILEISQSEFYEHVFDMIVSILEYSNISEYIIVYSCI